MILSDIKCATLWIEHKRYEMVRYNRLFPFHHHRTPNIHSTIPIISKTVIIYLPQYSYYENGNQKLRDCNQVISIK